ncbi:MAG TPA: hypothetical protein VG826_32495 [Pirellulales bacterium]|nr:hypothetical protein [Pirellulales bacterium]
MSTNVILKWEQPVGLGGRREAMADDLVEFVQVASIFFLTLRLPRASRPKEPDKTEQAK